MMRKKQDLGYRIILMTNAWVDKNRQKLLIGGPLLVLIICLIFYLLSGRYILTDDAYVRAGNVEISANISERVEKIYVHDNQLVKKGQPLFKLDSRNYKIAVLSAEAKLKNTRMKIQALKASLQQQMANINAAKDTFIYQKQEF